MMLTARIAILTLACSMVSCGPSEQSAESTDSTKPTIYTSFYPLTYFAERIGGEHVKVICPVPADADPRSWRPTRDDIAALQQADLIVLHGAGLEAWADQVSLPESRVIVVTDPFADKLITTKKPTHSHGPAGDHAHGDVDPHVWHMPHWARQEADHIREALVTLLPEHTQQINHRFFRKLSPELSDLYFVLDDLDTDGVTFLCSHPAYNYLGADFEWTIVNFDIEPGQPIGDQQWSKIIDTVGASQGRVIMLWTSPPLAQTSARLDSILGVRSVVFDPCEMLSAERIAAGEDYLSVMQANIQGLSAALDD